jgi:hypothetical protein
MAGRPELEVRMGTMAIPDHTGHTSVAWRPDDLASVAVAERTFATLADQRLVPFARRAPDDEFEQVRRFEAELDEIVWVRPLQGG